MRLNKQYLNDSVYQKKLRSAWENFIAHNETADYSVVRPEVLASWERSRSAGVAPYDVVKALLSEDELAIKLNENASLISIIRPYMQQIYSVVQGTGAYILVSDRDGYLLEVIGDEEIINGEHATSKLVRGACRNENVAGTNAIGTAIYMNKPIQLWGEEHYCDHHKPFSCACAPFYDENGHLLGAINITLIKDFAHPHTMGMAVCAADSITREIKLKATLSNVELLNKQRNLIIENMTAGVFLLSSDGIVLQANTTGISMLDLSFSEIIGRKLSEFVSNESVSTSENICKILQTEYYNVEARLTLRRHGLSNSTYTRVFNISTNHIRNASNEITNILVRVNHPDVIQKLVKRVSGYHAKYSLDDIIGESDVMRQMKLECEKISSSESNVLIMGASGTGKELIAHSIHNSSPVAKGPFVAINCAAIPNSLVESELFGYEKGSFTGASKEGRPGKFELADGGTIFLDEIGDMPLDVQATLLRVLQTKEIIRIGGNTPKQINIRIIAATNHDLLKAIEEKTFREDLYYRLNVFSIYAPLLKERGTGDIKLLADYFVDAYNASKGKNIKISDETYRILCCYSWPGNVRQLENVIERAINLTDNDLITPDLLPHQILNDSTVSQMSSSKTSMSSNTPSQSTAAAAAASVQPPPLSDEPSAKELDKERALIESALLVTKGSVTKAASMLDMNRRTLYRRLERFGIDPAQYRSK